MDDDVKLATAEAVGGQVIPGVSSYHPVASDLASIRSPAVIAGTDFHQMLQISLAPGDMITAEPGTMVMLSGDLRPSVDTGGCGKACRRACCAGGSLFRLVFENKTQEPQYLGLAPKIPGRLIPLPLDKWSGVTLTSGVFVACYGRDWDFNIVTVATPLAFCAGGQGLFLPRLTGTGTAFIVASGAVEMINLGEGEKIVVDQPNLVAFSSGVKFDVRAAGNCLTCCCGGMGLFNAVLEGPGTVIVESLPVQKLAQSLFFAAQGGGGGGGGAA